MMELVFSVLIKTLIFFSPQETSTEQNLVYNFAMAHSNNREHVIQELETYGYSRKGWYRRYKEGIGR